MRKSCEIAASIRVRFSIRLRNRACMALNAREACRVSIVPVSGIGGAFKSLPSRSAADESAASGAVTRRTTHTIARLRDPVRRQYDKAADRVLRHGLELGHGQTADGLVRPSSSFEPFADRLRRFMRGVRLPFVIRHRSPVEPGGTGRLGCGCRGRRLRPGPRTGWLLGSRLRGLAALRGLSPGRLRRFAASPTRTARARRHVLAVHRELPFLVRRQHHAVEAVLIAVAGILAGLDLDLGNEGDVVEIGETAQDPLLSQLMASFEPRQP